MAKEQVADVLVDVLIATGVKHSAIVAGVFCCVY
jgi:hypothetical protein